MPSVNINVNCCYCGLNITDASQRVRINSLAARYACRACYSERFTECSHCDGRISRDSAYHFDNDEETILCSSCYERASTWGMGEFAAENNTTVNSGSNRKFGVEIETSSCHGYQALRNKTIWGAKYDGSISGREFVSPPMHGDAGLAEVERFCKQINRMGFAVNSDCGLHVHFDMNGESEAQLKSIAYAYLLADKAWRMLVNRRRRENCSYCRQPRFSKADLLNMANSHGRFEDWASYIDRYASFNVASYVRHQTFEIRLYQGTINGREITNWIRAHLAFIEAVRNLSFDEIDALFGNTNEQAWVGLKRVIAHGGLCRHYGRVYKKEHDISTEQSGSNRRTVGATR